MFLSHVGMALAVKYLNPKQSLLPLSMAALGPDLLHVILAASHIEVVSLINDASGLFAVSHDIIGYSHSLVSVGIISVLLIMSSKQGRWWAGLWMGHWALDAVMARHDLPLWMDGSGPKVGWGLLSHTMGFLLIEGSLFGIGLWLYRKGYTGRYKIKPRFWVGMMVIVGLFLGSVLSTPNATEDLIGYGPLLLAIPWLMGWIDTQRPQTYESLSGLHRSPK